MRPKSEFRFNRTLWLPVGVVVALALIFSLASSAFPTVRNLTIVSAQASTLLIVCTGATFVVLMGSIDLSVGAVVLLVGAISAKIGSIDHFDTRQWVEPAGCDCLSTVGH